MDLNSDYSKRVRVHSGSMDWESSEMAGVERRRLDRVRSDQPDEAVTTVVRYAPGSHFSPHVHTGGEEFVVIDGVFQDEHGDYPTGMYVRNPPTSSHTPGSEDGCTILVKLWQFDLADRQSVRLKIDRSAAVDEPDRPGVGKQSLFSDARETVSVEWWAPDSDVELDVMNGVEFFVLKGGFVESGDELIAESWLRVPAGTAFKARSLGEGAVVWIKQYLQPMSSV